MSANYEQRSFPKERERAHVSFKNDEREPNISDERERERNKFSGAH